LILVKLSFHNTLTRLFGKVETLLPKEQKGGNKMLLLFSVEERIGLMFNFE